jgi:hypothetical protein
VKIFNTNVYGIDESIKASGYPRSLNDNPLHNTDRAKVLAKCKPGSGHDCFLKGITVNMDVNAPSYWWPQFQRYHFADIISSQSKMYSITKFNIDEICNEWVTKESKDQLKRFIELYNNYGKDLEEIFFTSNDNMPEINSKQDIFQLILSNCPMGLNLTARITTNYLQLKTIYNQRKNHKLKEWEVFCKWIEELPMALDLIY